MYEGWMSLGGSELVNNSRTAAYARAFGIRGIGCTDCGDISSTLGDAPYTLPADDDAPWYDPAVPASARFGGLMALDVAGTDGTGSRQVQDLLGDGAALGVLRYTHRELLVHAVAVAGDEEAMSYGLAWLASALRGRPCGGCGGDELCMFAYCPCCDGLGDFACGDKAVRTLYDVGLIGGPSVTRRRLVGAGCAGCTGVIAELDFTLAAGRPWFYRPPTPVIAPLTIPRASADDCIEWLSGTGCAPTMRIGVVGGPRTAAADPCAATGTVDCLADPNLVCPDIPAAPLPPQPVDPCSQVCYEGAGADIAWLNVPASMSPQWLDTVPVLNIFTGSEALRGLLIRFFANPFGGDCAAIGPDLDPCTACGTLEIPYLPPHSTLSIDGRTQRTVIDCAGPGGRTDASNVVFGEGGQLFTWPVFSCSGFCVQIVAGAHADDAQVSLQIAAREDSA